MMDGTVQTALVGLSSSIVGGLTVLAGQWLQHRLERSARIEERRYDEEARLGELALSVVNWLEMDKQRVFDAAGGPIPEIEFPNPVHKLAAMMRRFDPRLTTAGAEMLHLFRDYCDCTRLLLPRAQVTDQNQYKDRIAADANRLMELLDQILQEVLPSRAATSSLADGWQRPPYRTAAALEQ